MGHEELRAFLDQARLRLSLVEVLVYKGDRLTDVIYGKVASVSLSSVELKLKSSAEATVHFDFSRADVRPYKREKPLEGWKVRFANRETLVFLELPQLEIAA